MGNLMSNLVGDLVGDLAGDYQKTSKQPEDKEDNDEMVMNKNRRRLLQCKSKFLAIAQVRLILWSLRCTKWCE
jgi:hypothetical protein